VRTMVRRVKIRAEQRRLAVECLLHSAPG
jgi:hypothetical protein